MEARISELETELASVRASLDAEKAYRLELEDERNFLFNENSALRAQLNRLPVTSHISAPNDAQPDAIARIDTTTISSHKGDKVLQINKACGDKNVICCAFMSTGSSVSEDKDIILCGGVDASVSAYDFSSGTFLCKWIMSAPVLTMDVHERRVACGTMDGTHAVITLQGLEEDAARPGVCVPVAQVAHWRLHAKYVVQVVWSPCGEYLCTVSHDKTVGIYQNRDGALELVRTIACSTTPECAAFLLVCNVTERDVASTKEAHIRADASTATSSAPARTEEPDSLDEYFAQLAMKKAQAEKPMVPPAAVLPERTPTLAESASHGCDDAAGNAERGLELVLGLRDVPYLLYIDCATGTARQVSLNENAWDTHVSFAPLSLVVSPGGDRLLVATDKNMHILLEAGSNRRLQIFSGHSCGAYGKPSVCWSWRGDFVYSNSDDENIVYVYCARSGKIVDRLVGHGKGIVRGLAAHNSKDLVLSASYDKSVILWKCAAVTL